MCHPNVALHQTDGTLLATQKPYRSNVASQHPVGTLLATQKPYRSNVASQHPVGTLLAYCPGFDVMSDWYVSCLFVFSCERLAR